MNGDALAVPPARDAAGARVARFVRPAVLLFLVFTGAGLVSATQIYVSYSMGTQPMAFIDAALWQMPPWWVWGAFTPGVFYLVRRFPLERGTWPMAVAVHLLANTVLAFPHLASSVLSGRVIGLTWYLDVPLGDIIFKMFAKNAHMEVLTYWGIVAAAHALSYRRAWQEQAVAAAQLETRLAQAQLEALRMQLHPHFLFNTLNAVATLVRKQDTQNAVRMLAGLSDLLRIALDSTGRQVVPLKQELDFLDRYLAIERLRFGDRLTVDVSVAPDTLDVQVPNLLLQPIVENALRHGLGPRVEPGHVAITTRRDGDRLVITVRDDGVGLRSGWVPGLGLGNVRARLEQLYGGAHRLSLDAAPGGGTLVTVEIPVRHD